VFIELIKISKSSTNHLRSLVPDPELMGHLSNVAPPSTAPPAPSSHAAEGKKQLKSPRAAPAASSRVSAGIVAAGAASLSPPAPAAGRKAILSPALPAKHTPGMVQPLSARLPGGAPNGMYDALDHGIMQQQDRAVSELRETVEVLQLKVSKLEQLLKLKDSKIETLQGRLAKLAPPEQPVPQKK
jgi:hypothetical protein